MTIRFLCLLLGLMSAPTFAVETYQSALFGLQITKPDSWQTMNGTSDGVTVLERDKARLAQAIKLNLAAPLVELAKYREPFADVSPSVEIGIGEFGELKSFTGTGILVKYFEVFAKGFANFELEQLPGDTTLGGRAAGYARFRHIVDVATVGKVAIVSEMWAIPRGDFYVLVAAATRADGKTGARAEIDPIIQTVRFVD